jgi:hypothetical protein
MMMDQIITRTLFPNDKKDRKHLVSLANVLTGVLCGCLLALVTIREGLGHRRLKEPTLTNDLTTSDSTQRGLRALEVKRIISVPPQAPERTTLVLYSGPVRLPVPNTSDPAADQLHITNFEFFLSNGVDCGAHDTVLVLGEQVLQEFGASLDSMNQACRALGHFIKLVPRGEDGCGHVESMRLALHAGVVDVDRYDYLLYASSDLLGPSPTASFSFKSWTTQFVQRFHDEIHMVGLSHSCRGRDSHVKSDVFALDKKGIELIRNSNVVSDCKLDRKGSTVGRYEIEMSRTILNAGYKIHSILGDLTLDKASQNRCTIAVPDSSLSEWWTVSRP